MKCTIPEIAWHNRDPILSVDIQPSEESFYRLASGGTDCHVLIWHLRILKNGSVQQEVVSDLTRHQRAVNVVKWSPLGKYLATGDDDANIIIWTLKTDNIPSLEFDLERENKETWNVFKVLRGHKEDVYDISWSPDETKLLSGSIDNTAILWNVQNGKNELILKDHKGFVQGCAWDPQGQLIATLSSDRVCRIFNATGKKLQARIVKGKLPVSESHHLFDKEVKYFHDDTFKSYFRRLCFSPDGNMLITPSGCVETEDCKKAFYATYIFTLNSLSDPAIILPSPKQCTVAAKCCPILFELRQGCDPVVDLPYRMVIAIATDSNVYLYDTQQEVPFAVLRNIHYTRLTDLTWSSDGRLLVASSTDGFCTLITFEPNELGTPYVKEDVDLEESVLNVSGCAELDVDDVPEEKMEVKVEVKVKEESKPKKPSFLEQWTIKTPKRASTSRANNAESSKSNRNDKAGPSTPNAKLEKSKAVPSVSDVIDLTDSPVKNDSANKSMKKIIPIKLPDEKTASADSDVNSSDRSSTNTKRIVPVKVIDNVPKKKVKLNTLTKPSTPTNKSSVDKVKASPRASPLDNFIQKLAKSAPLLENSTLRNEENVSTCTIAGVLDEGAARDAWKVEVDIKPTPSTISSTNKEITGSVIHDKTLTDAPEDFKLTVDESMDASNKSTSRECKAPRRVSFITISSKSEKKATTEKVVIDKKEHLEEVLDIEKKENCEKVTDIEKKENAATTVEPVENIDDSINGVAKEIPKTPRRVPLITLSSPHHKKKKTA